jgi:hypothetical protein
MATRLRLAVTGVMVAGVMVGTASRLGADDAKKRELKLAICAANYTTALRACANLADATACYQKADADDLACRKALDAAGHSTVEPGVDKRKAPPTGAFTVRKPLNCGTGLNATCADGHARFPICANSGEQDLNASQGRGGVSSAAISQDAQGDKDVCSGQTLRCPAGFSIIVRKGQDLCWDSVENSRKYVY